ncbi:hypothetical protein VN1236_05560 [Helicobacter pylori]|nr:hypothetical protein VN1236_05560 [Helicobacter pylori]
MKTFKNLLCFSLIAMGWLQADMLDNFTRLLTATPLKSLMKSRSKQTALTPLRPILMAFSLTLIVKS